MGHSLCQTASGQLKAEVTRPAVVLLRHKCGGVVQGVWCSQRAVGPVHRQL